MKYITIMKILSLLCFISMLDSMLHAQGVGLNEESRLSVGGFMSMDYYQLDLDDEDNVLAGYSPNVVENSTFWQSHLNLYIQYKSDDNWLAFSEVRICYAPTGMYQMTPNDTDPGDTNPLTGLPTDPDYTVSYDTEGGLPAIFAFPANTEVADQYFYRYRYGSIFIERAYIEWNQFSFANLRFGRFITPFGIYSQDHASPALTGIRPPVLVSAPESDYAMPNTQTGVELLGSLDLVSEIILEYAAFVGNGVSTSDSENDNFDKNKSVGGFINFILPQFSNISVEIGGSCYFGERSLLFYKYYSQNLSTDPETGQSYVTLSNLSNGDRFTAKQMEKTALAHFKAIIYDLPLEGVFTVQAEGMKQWIEPKDDTRIINPLTLIPKEQGDWEYYTFYTQVEYQMFGKLSLYYRYDQDDVSSEEAQKLVFRERLFVNTVGVNFKPKPSISFKAEMLDANVVSKYGSDNGFKMYAVQVTMAFL